MELECKHLEVVLYSRWRNFEHRLPTLLELLRPFLMRNRNSITLLVTDVPTILILHQNGLLELFPRLKHLRIKAQRLLEADREQLFPIVSNFSQILPQLVSLALENQHGVHPLFALEFPIIMDPISIVETLVQREEGIVRRGLKELIIRECYDLTLVETWAAIFPEIENLVVSAAPKTYDVNLSHIWRCWPSLVSLEVICHGMNSLNFNSTVCGCSPAKMKTLQKKSFGQLEQSMIVPSRPAITGMTSLEQFRVYIVSEKAYWKKIKCPVPKISQALAFGRKKNLKVQFQYTPKYQLGRGDEMSI